jgi:hypothetical protein
MINVDPLSRARRSANAIPRKKSRARVATDLSSVKYGEGHIFFLIDTRKHRQIASELVATSSRWAPVWLPITKDVNCFTQRTS